MKISNRNILRIARLYGLANDNTPLKSLLKVHTRNLESYVSFSFTLNKKSYFGLYGSVVDEDDIDQLWPEKPKDAEILINPLDNSNYTTPFHGKYVALFQLVNHKKRLDTYLASTFDPTISRNLWQKYIEAGYVKVEGQAITMPSSMIFENDNIQIEIPDTPVSDIELQVLYEDSDVLVVNKPAGLLTHAKGGIASEQSLADIIKDKTTFQADTDRSGIVHRLDRDTSGLIIIARNPDSAASLQEQFAKRLAKKTYLAIVEGEPKLHTAKIDLPIGRNPSKPSTFRIDPKGKSAQTTYEILAKNNHRSLVLLKPRTGRTHQLRVHMAHIGTPIVGDKVYGKPDTRMMLHAYKLELSLPSGKSKEFISKPPSNFYDKFPDLAL